MFEEYIVVDQSPSLKGEVSLAGAKNATLVIMASSLLVEGKLKLKNVPYSKDVFNMATILEELGAQVTFDEANRSLEIDTFSVVKFKVNPEIMKKMRASVLVMGPLLARFGRAEIAAPGGCRLGQRPINFHLSNFSKMGATIENDGNVLTVYADKLAAKKLVLEYPSVGATENLMMAACLTLGITSIINAALEPEVLDLIEVLKKMGAKISICAPATIQIEGVSTMHSAEHTIMCDRLEAGSLILAAAITSGDIHIPNADAQHLDVFLLKLEEMGHSIIVGPNNIGIRFIGTQTPQAVSFKTAQYPCFPTDLQAPMMVAQCLAEGVSEIEETVFENRLLGHAIELQKMGANIKFDGNSKAIVTGVNELIGCQLVASDIRASCALVLAGFVAKGRTLIKGVHHFQRGYEGLDAKLAHLGGKINIDRFDLIENKVITDQIINI